MDKEKFESVVSILRPGQLIEIVQLDPSWSGFYRDIESGDKQPIRQPYYFASGTSISFGNPGISVTGSLNDRTGQVEPAYVSIPHGDIISITLLYREKQE